MTQRRDRRDRLASVKLLSASLRLERFTSKELAKFAGVDEETARSFVKRQEREGLFGRDGHHTVEAARAAAPVGLSQTQSKKVRGRPASRYRLLAEQRAQVLASLIGLRGEIDRAGPSLAEARSARDWPSPMELLEIGVKRLDEKDVDGEYLASLIRQANTFLAGAEAHLAGLVSRDIDVAEQRRVAERINEAKRKIEAHARLKRKSQTDLVVPERMSATIMSSIPTVCETIRPSRVELGAADNLNYYELFAPLVEQYGKWAEGPKALDPFDPVVVLLDGVQGSDPVADRVTRICRTEGVSLAIIELTQRTAQIRSEIYGMIDRLRLATPIALANVLMTLDSRESTGFANQIAREVQELSIPGRWKTKTHDLPLQLFKDTTELNEEACRSFYLSRVSLHGMRTKHNRGHKANKFYEAYVKRFSDTNFLFGAIRVSEETNATMPHGKAIGGAASVAESLLNVAVQVMGRIYCLDIADGANMKQHLLGASVRYAPKADKESDDTLRLWISHH